VVLLPETIASAGSLPRAALPGSSPAAMAPALSSGASLMTGPIVGPGGPISGSLFGPTAPDGQAILAFSRDPAAVDAIPLARSDTPGPAGLVGPASSTSLSSTHIVLSGQPGDLDDATTRRPMPEFLPRDLTGHVIYVLDRSGSMARVHKFDFVGLNLRTRLHDVNGPTEFEVIFYWSPAVRGPNEAATQLQPNDPESVAKVAAWYGYQCLNGVGPEPLFRPRDAATLAQVDAKLPTFQPGGGTSPQEPLLLALRQKPDEVVFLTDGEFSDSDLDIETVLKANVSKARIHVVRFGTAEQQATETVVERLARACGTTPTYVVTK
jgi:hypothetical protein